MTIMESLEQLIQELSHTEGWFIYKLNGSYNAFSKEETTVRWIIEITFYDKSYKIVYVPAFQAFDFSMYLPDKDKKRISGNNTYTVKNEISYQVYMEHNDEYMSKIKNILFALEDMSKRPLDSELWNALDNE